MSSEFDQYFQEFLGDDSNDFDIYKGDFTSEPDGLYHSNNWQLLDRANSFHPDPRDPSTSNMADPAPGSELLLPEADTSTDVGIGTIGTNPEEEPEYPSPMDLLGSGSPTIASPFPCSWISCSTRSTKRNEAEMTTHLEAHWKEILEQWLGPKGCDWPDCKSRAIFKFPGSLKKHIFNLHINPLVCTYPQCTYPNPFGKQGDLRRHIETVHESSCSHMCPVESCEANIKGFTRKDKLLNHLREQHDHLRCPYNHCYSTVLETEQDAHLQQFHGSFECALGACGRGPASRFLEFGLRRHLRRHHNMTVDPARVLIRRVKETKDNTARPIHIVMLRKWKDCPACSEAQSVSGFVQNNEDLETQGEDRTSQG